MLKLQKKTVVKRCFSVTYYVIQESCAVARKPHDAACYSLHPYSIGNFVMILLHQTSASLLPVSEDHVPVRTYLERKFKTVIISVQYTNITETDGRTDRHLS